MTDETIDGQDRKKRNPPPAGLNAYLKSKEPEDEGAEDSVKAFGFLRGIKESATSVEFRFRTGNSCFFPYGLMGPWKYNPSEGLLLKFSGDLVYLVLIRVSNLDKPVSEGAINLTRAGLQRHRVLWVREMTKEEIRQVGDTGPTIDSIEIGECQSHDDVKAWVGAHAPGFLK